MIQPSDIRKGDTVILFNGAAGVALGKCFQMTSEFKRLAVPVHFEEWEGPIQLEAITEIWRAGVKIEPSEQLTYLKE